MVEETVLKLVIADDEYPIREMLRRSINWQERYIEVLGVVEDGGEVIELVKKYSPDIVLSDIKMLDMDGIELSRWISQNYPDTRVIFLTAYSNFEHAQKAIQYGVADYLLKPVDENRLFETIGKIRREIAVKRKENAEITKLIGLSVNSGKSEVDRIYESMKSFRWQDAVQYIKEFFDNYLEEGDVAQSYPYSTVIELLSVIKRLQASSEYAFLGYSISSDKINELKKLKDKQSVCSAVTKMFEEYFGHMLEQRKSSSKNLIKDIKDYVSSHCADIISLTDTCSLFFISPSSMSKLFKRECGMTFSDYLIQCRIEKAKRILACSDAKIYEVSSQAGYSSEKHFIREFKRYAGMSPGKFREAVSQQKSMA